MLLALRTLYDNSRTAGLMGVGGIFTSGPYYSWTPGPDTRGPSTSVKPFLANYTVSNVNAKADVIVSNKPPITGIIISNKL